MRIRRPAWQTFATSNDWTFLAFSSTMDPSPSCVRFRSTDARMSFRSSDHSPAAVLGARPSLSPRLREMHETRSPEIKLRLHSTERVSVGFRNLVRPKSRAQVSVVGGGWQTRHGTFVQLRLSCRLRNRRGNRPRFSRKPGPPGPTLDPAPSERVLRSSHPALNQAGGLSSAGSHPTLASGLRTHGTCPQNRTACARSSKNRPQSRPAAAPRPPVSASSRRTFRISPLRHLPNRKVRVVVTA